VPREAEFQRDAVLAAFYDPSSYGSEGRARVVSKELARCIRAIQESDPSRGEKAEAVKETAVHLIMLDRPWRWWCLRMMLMSLWRRPLLEPNIFWPVFVTWWPDCEANLMHGWLPTTLAARHRIWGDNAYDYLDPEDKKFFDALPDRIAIYRGMQEHGRYVGLSWTTNEKVAVWFARRFYGNNRILLSGYVRKTSVIAAFNERNENEVLCLPQHVHGRTKKRVRGENKAWGGACYGEPDKEEEPCQ
jgi:hypothetical protein